MASSAKEPNGTVRARKVPREKSRVRKDTKNIVAIDFGTKNCSVAYITENDQLEITMGIPKLPLNGSHLRVPTAVLFTPDGMVESFGSDARSLYLNLEDADRQRYIYFEEIKMNLHKDQEVVRELTIKDMNGHDYYLVDVISHILRYLKDEFLVHHLRRSGQYSVTASSVHWVVTVPAIWRARGKQLMREAGYKAGLCSDQPFVPLTTANACHHFITEDSNPDHLSLALESESAALYCQEMLRRGLVAPFCDNPSGKYKPHSYLLLDVGGGTVDISAHKVRNYKSGVPVVEEIIPSTGNDCGGTMVNREFVVFLEHLCGDVGFTNYLETPDGRVNVRNRCELNHLIGVVFEEQKQIFGRLPKEKRRETVLRLPSSMIEMYKDNILDCAARLGSSRVKLVRQNLRISVKQMEELFSPVVEGLLSIVHDTINALKGSVDVIYLVGGFGGSPYLYWKILEEFSISYKCIVPPNPEYAIVEGAVIFQANPNAIQSRRMATTYGKSVIRPFDSKIHNPHYRIFDDQGVPLCDNLFQTIVERDEAVSLSHVYMCSSVTCKDSQKNMCIEIYRSPCHSKDVWYVTGYKGQVEKVGEIVFHFEDTSTLLPTSSTRKVDFTFDFSHTEIQVLAYEQSTKRKVKAVINFLSQ